MSDEHQIPWGLAGPTDPAERAFASRLDRDGDHFGLIKPIEWPTEGVLPREHDPVKDER